MTGAADAAAQFLKGMKKLCVDAYKTCDEAFLAKASSVYAHRLP